MQYYSGGDCVVLGIVPASPTSWVLGIVPASPTSYDLSPRLITKVEQDVKLI